MATRPAAARRKRCHADTQNDAAGMVTPDRESMSRVASATFSLMGTYRVTL
ncbi:MAG: hypothetical protein ACLTZW_07575 [Paratractidigestivibacter faecalis]